MATLREGLKSLGSVSYTHLFVKGEGLEKRADDFASEVASMVK